MNIIYNAFKNNQSFHHFPVLQCSVYKTYKIEDVIVGKNYTFQ